MAKPEQKSRNFTVPEVWRTIVKKNERQGGKLYDVLVCQHAVPANDNTYRKARACPTCRVRVQQYADEVAVSGAPQAPRRPAAGRSAAAGSKMRRSADTRSARETSSAGG